MVESTKFYELNGVEYKVSTGGGRLISSEYGVKEGDVRAINGRPFYAHFCWTPEPSFFFGQKRTSVHWVPMTSRPVSDLEQYLQTGKV